LKAVVITKPGGPEVLQIQNRPVPVPSENDVLIKIKAAGVNRPDIAQRKGNYPPPPGASPDIPGLEVAGIIEQCGSAVTRWKPGDPVCALLTGGGYAEYVTAPAGQCLPLPKGWNYREAASLPETIFTVWHNVFQIAKLQAGEHFLVHGGGSGIGITAIQLAKAFGAKVFATAGSAEKCTACTTLGADNCINYKKTDFETELKSQGVDVILDMIGGDYLPKNIRILRPDGRLVFINAMKGNPSELDVMAVMYKRLTITGSTLRNREVSFKSLLAKEIEAQIWPLLENGKFKSVIYRSFPLQEAYKAHEALESSEHIGKIVLINE
jgi:NADPH2:quinone reductase